MTDYYFYPAVEATGGSLESLDALDGSALGDGDCIFLCDLNTYRFKVYRVDADSGLTDNGDGIIAPDSNAGDKRFTKIFDGGRVLLPASDVDQGDSSIIGTLAWHIANATTNKTTVTVLPGTHTISQNITVPATITLRFEHGGIIADDASNANLTINGEVLAGAYQIFNWGNGSGSITFGVGSVEAILPEWWNVDGTADELQINAALTAASTNKLPVVLGAKTYSCADTIIHKSGVRLYGVSYAGSIISYTQAADYAVQLTDCQGSTVENLTINVTNASAAGAILIEQTGTNNSWDNRILNCILDSTGARNDQIGISLAGAAAGYANYFNHVDKCKIKEFETSIKMELNSNANFIGQNVYWDFQNGIHIEGHENVVNGGFFHYARGDADTVRCIYIQGTVSDPAKYNLIFMNGEPRTGVNGGSTYSYELGQYSGQNLIIANWNVALGGVDNYPENRNNVFSATRLSYTRFKNKATFIDDGTPNVYGLNRAIIANTGSTDITDLDNGEDGQHITFLINGANAVFKEGANFKLAGSADFTAGSGDSITFVYDSAIPTWWEVSRMER